MQSAVAFLADLAAVQHCTSSILLLTGNKHALADAWDQRTGAKQASKAAMTGFCHEMLGDRMPVADLL